MFKRIREQSNHTAAISLGVSITAIYIALVAHASATNFKAGYLSYFGIDIRHVDYWPSIAEFMNQPLIVLLAIVALLAIYLAVALIINGLHWVLQWFAKKMNWKKLLNFIDEKPFGRTMITGTLITLFLFFSFKLPLFDSYDRGVESAREQRNFTVLVSEDDNEQVLIYQYGGVGLLKTYDPNTKSFDKAYETIDISGKRFEAVRLIND